METSGLYCIRSTAQSRAIMVAAARPTMVCVVRNALEVT